MQDFRRSIAILKSAMPQWRKSVFVSRMHVMEDPALKSSDIFMIQIAVPEQESCPEWQVLVIYISHKFVGDFSFLFSLLFGLAGNQRYHPQRTVPNANQPSCYSLFFFLFFQLNCFSKNYSVIHINFTGLFLQRRIWRTSVEIASLLQKNVINSFVFASLIIFFHTGTGQYNNPSIINLNGRFDNTLIVEGVL